MEITPPTNFQLIYYKQYHSAQKEEFIEALNLLRKGETDLSFMDKLSPHARWLSAVYTGQELTSKWCYGGSRFHKKLMNLLGDGSPPKLIIRHVRDLKDEINKLQIRFSQVNPKVIENIAVDESFERIGRVLS